MFSLSTKSTGRALIVVALALACMPGVASARLIDPVPTPAQDLRSPDARDAALAQERYYSSYSSQPRQDLRSPDTRDIAEGRTYPPVPAVVSVKQIEPAPDTGFDWVAASAGAAVMLGVLLLATAGGVVVTRRRAHHRQPVAAA